MTDTPADKWNDTVTAYRKKCQAILALSGNIRYVGIVNSYGRTVTGILKTGVKPILTRENAREEFFVVPTMIGLRKYTEEEMGRLEYAILSHRKLSVIVLQRDTITYYITISKKEKDIAALISRIKKIARP